MNSTMVSTVPSNNLLTLDHPSPIFWSTTQLPAARRRSGTSATLTSTFTVQSKSPGEKWAVHGPIGCRFSRFVKRGQGCGNHLFGTLLAMPFQRPEVSGCVSHPKKKVSLETGHWAPALGMMGTSPPQLLCPDEGAELKFIIVNLYPSAAQRPSLLTKVLETLILLETEQFG